MSEWGDSDGGSPNKVQTDHRDNDYDIDVGSDAGGGEEREKVTYEPEYNANEDPDIFNSDMLKGIDFEKYFDIPIKITGDNAPKAISKFEDANLHPALLKNIANCKWTKPTPIQTASLPIISGKRDLMACAQTGSGKTGGFAMPIIDRLLKDGDVAEEIEDRGPIKPQVLVVAPTRELVQQIHKDFAKLCRGTELKAQFAVGGHAVRHQLDRLQEGTNILCATPGRLNDFVGKNKVCLEELKFLVLDEADRMLDMGFKSVLDELAHKMSDKEARQTLMFSATFPDSVQQLGKDMLKTDYLFCAIGMLGGAADSVTQTIIQVEKKETFSKLQEICEPAKDKGERTLIFVETKRQTDYIASKLCQLGYPTTSIHGDRSQMLREQAIRTFKSGEHPILVATNVAARGLDIPNVAHVVNMEMPKDVDEYVHRIGRTGRCGNKGKATSFFDEERDGEIVEKLKNILAGSHQIVPDFLLGGGGGAIPGAAADAGGDDDDDGW